MKSITNLIKIQEWRLLTVLNSLNMLKTIKHQLSGSFIDEAMIGLLYCDLVLMYLHFSWMKPQINSKLSDSKGVYIGNKSSTLLLS